MNRLFTLLFAIPLLSLLPSCGDQWEEPKPSAARRTVLVYAVASNNLASDLVSDQNEMIQAAPDVAGLGSDVRVLLYSVPSQTATEATLAELSKDDATGAWTFQPLKSYDRNTFSTDPERMREVFADLREQAPADNYGLILWSHGTGWIPNFSDHQVPGLQKSYGMDKYQGATDYCDIDELAMAIPDRMFDYVWFDLCYMMGIEVAYQLRSKCDYVAGYPTEDWSMGMNYETTLPFLAASEPDLAGAGKAFYDYYTQRNMAVTVTVVKTDGLDRLAHAAKAIYAYGANPENTYGLMNYSRLRTGLYDFGQFTKKWLDPADSEAQRLQAEFDAAIADMTLFAGCSTKNFNGSEGAFQPEEYSGFSCYFPGSADAATDNYYSTLDWPQAVY